MEMDEEEYLVWKKNAPLLYDRLVTHSLEWPSLTVQWLNKPISLQNGTVNQQQVLIGTHTSDPSEHPNSLLLCNVTMPSENHPGKDSVSHYANHSDLKVQVKLAHPGEVNRARAMPQDELILASFATTGEVLIFDISKHPSTPEDDTKVLIQYRQKMHSKEGYGLDWNPNRKGQLATGADDGMVSVWNFDEEQESKVMSKENAHSGVVGEVEWHRSDPQVLGSVGEDGLFKLWDIRCEVEQMETKLCTESKENIGDLNTLSLCPFDPNLVLVGGSSHNVDLFDLRKIKDAMHRFEGHTEQVLKVEWSLRAEEKGLFVSCAEDNRVIVWDVARIGEEQSSEEQEIGPPELVFRHGGHTGRVSDVSLNALQPCTVASVAEDNVIHFWQPSQDLLKPKGL